MNADIEMVSIDDSRWKEHSFHIARCFWCDKTPEAKPCRMATALGGTHHDECNVHVLGSTSQVLKDFYYKQRQKKCSHKISL